MALMRWMVLCFIKFLVGSSRWWERSFYHYLHCDYIVNDEKVVDSEQTKVPEEKSPCSVGVTWRNRTDTKKSIGSIRLYIIINRTILGVRIVVYTK